MGATTPISGTLSADLRTATREVHERAHHSVYMSALVDGSLPLDAYTLLAEQYSAIYTALEAASDAMAGDPLGGRFVIDELRRVPALHDDLDALGSGVPRILPATDRYVARLRTAAADPERYLAHHYVRYLGDLAGGQVLCRQLNSTYDLSDGGARFYDFTALGPVPPFRARYRELIDTAPWAPGARERIIDEAVHAFELNIAVLDEMATEVGLEQPLAS
ncbi:biliverdin-producing heme oxygenase [Pseudonocardia phyllosphaerae]|uniref:biliverdin-producing heme oxygenase n=1 Tax=Pseudonocardia phyllosphaerae TaxID=3390502 RepID=UPI00397AD52F